MTDPLVAEIGRLSKLCEAKDVELVWFSDRALANKLQAIANEIKEV